MGCKRGQRKGPRQKTSKFVKECQDKFRHSSTIFAQGKNIKNRQKESKIIFDTFDIFRAAPIFPQLSENCGKTSETNLRIESAAIYDLCFEALGLLQRQDLTVESCANTPTEGIQLNACTPKCGRHCHGVTLMAWGASSGWRHFSFGSGSSRCRFGELWNGVWGRDATKQKSVKKSPF